MKKLTNDDIGGYEPSETTEKVVALSVLFFAVLIGVLLGKIF